MLHPSWSMRQGSFGRGGFAISGAWAATSRKNTMIDRPMIIRGFWEGRFSANANSRQAGCAEGAVFRLAVSSSFMDRFSLGYERRICGSIAA
jgi:hypothetical protein